MSNIREDICALAEALSARMNPDETLEYIYKIESRLRILKCEADQKKADCAMKGFMQGFIGLLKSYDCCIHRGQEHDSIKIEIPGVFYITTNASFDVTRVGFQEPVELVVTMNDYRLTFRQQPDKCCTLINVEEENGGNVCNSL